MKLFKKFKKMKLIPTYKFFQYEKLLYISLLLALEKLVEKFEGFINPYVEQIVLITCRLYSHNLAAQRARVLWNSLVKHLAPHIVLEKANKMLLEVWQEPATVAKLSGNEQNNLKIKTSFDSNEGIANKTRINFMFLFYYL